MAKPIEFPLNFDRYLELGQEAMGVADFASAEFNFTQAYNLAADFEANRQLVESLVAQSRFKDALGIADEMQGHYLQTVPLVQLYLRLLLGNDAYIRSRKLLKQLRVPAAALADLSLEVEQGEQQFNRYQQQTLHTRQKQKVTISQGNFFQQGEVLKSWQKLPLAHYVPLVIEVIEGNLVNLLLKNSLLNDLVELDCQEQLTLTGLTGTPLTVATADLLEMDEAASFKAARTLLQEKVANQDSDLSRQLQEELRLQFSLLYPLADQLITEPAAWVAVFLENYLGTVVEATLAEASTLASYRELQEKISQELLLIFGA